MQGHRHQRLLVSVDNSSQQNKYSNWLHFVGLCRGKNEHTVRNEKIVHIKLIRANSLVLYKASRPFATSHRFH